MTDKDTETTMTKRPYSNGDTVEGTVVAVDRSKVFVDLPPTSTGIIHGQEFTTAKDILRKVRIGNTISAKIIAIENRDGYVDLSLKEARKAHLWAEAEEALQEKRMHSVIVKAANRGGLVINWKGVRGFLPASQLKEECHKTPGGDRDGLLGELRKYVGKEITVVIENLNHENETIIFSEHKDGAGSESADGKKANAKIRNIKVGDVRSGIVTGVVDFGVFVTIDNVVEGLVHISEMDWGLVDDPHKFYSTGNQVQVKVIGIEEEKYSFSFKELYKNPWEDAKDRYKVGDTASGVVIKYGSPGAFASIEAGISGLVHISNFEDANDLREALEIGKVYDFVITNLEPKDQKLTLVPKDKYTQS